MGEKRKGGYRGNLVPGNARDDGARRGTRKTPRPRRTSGETRGKKSREDKKRRRSSGAEVVSLQETRRARRSTGGQAGRRTSTGNSPRTVGHRRLRMAAAVFVMSGLLLGGRAAQMIVTDDERYQAFAAEHAGGGAPAAVEDRGSVISADGRKLATSLETARVIATPYQIEAPTETARTLEGVIGDRTGLDADELKAALTERNPDGGLDGYSVVASGITPAAAEEVESLGIEGITTSPEAERVYPDKALASQLTGYLGDYDEPFGGVESRYDKKLDSGEDVVLTLDTAVQGELEQALAAAIKKHRAQSALGLVMRVEDGAIVALANAPTYDNNRFGEASPEAQRDRVLTDPYEPGSTFKAFTVASALEEGAVTPASTFVVPDNIAVADRVIHDSMPHETKVMTPGDVLQESSNVGAIQVAQALGGPKLHDSIRRFGFGEPTGVDLWGEDPGDVPAYEDWSGSSIGNIPIGQGLTATPLQLVSGYSALVNGGTKVTPHVTQNSVSHEPGERVISEETSDIVRGMLQGVVEKGSGHYARIPGYTVAGKTGTSQNVDPETGTYGDRYIASFMCFAPAKDPEYAMLIAVDDPQSSYWGEVVAVPAARKVMEFTLGYFNVPPDDPSSAAKGRTR